MKSYEANRDSTPGPISGSPNSGPIPEFCRYGDLYQLVGLRRTHAYALVAKGKIKGVKLKSPGKQHGVSLIYVPSVLEYLHREMARQNGGAE